jgi:acid phosphatase type 7
VFLAKRISQVTVRSGCEFFPHKCLDLLSEHLVDHFRMPANESGGKGNFWYSFDYGLVHFITIDTETDLPQGIQSPLEYGGFDGGANSGPFGYPNQQMQWLEKDLANVDRNKTPWIVVGLHRPWYIDATTNVSGTVCTQCQKAFEPVMVKYGVDLYMQGHVHVSRRICLCVIHGR